MAKLSRRTRPGTNAPSRLPRRLAVLLAAGLVVTPVVPAGARATTPDPSAAVDRNDVISFEPDGFDPRYLTWYETPGLDARAARGPGTTGRSVFKGTSQVARSSIITGAYPERSDHQAYYYDFERDRAIRDEDPVNLEIQGPSGPSVPGIVADIDFQVGRLVEAAREAGILDRTTFIVGSDHGMGSVVRPLVPDLLSALAKTGFSHEIVPWGETVSSPQLEIVTTATSRSVSLHLRGAAAGPRGRAAVAEALAELDDRAIVLDRRDPARLHAGYRAGDFALSARSDCHFSTDLDRPPGGGHSGAEEIAVPLIMAGHRIRPGVRPRRTRDRRSCPDHRRLLDLRRPAGAQGRVLREVLRLAG